MKNVIPSAFITASALVVLLLGFVHLLFTFQGTRLDPRDPDLTTKMMAVSPVISSETTMWRLWIGFNVSHSCCLIFFGAVYGYLALRHNTFLFHSAFMLTLGFAVLLSFATLAKLYWFTSPFRGIVFAAVLYLVGILAKGA